MAGQATRHPRQRYRGGLNRGRNGAAVGSDQGGQSRSGPFLLAESPCDQPETDAALPTPMAALLSDELLNLLPRFCNSPQQSVSVLWLHFFH